MKIGLIKEEKLPVDKRVVLTPDQCKNIQEIYSNTELVVQSCQNRCFTDEQYKSKGIKVDKNNLNHMRSLSNYDTSSKVRIKNV